MTRHDRHWHSARAHRDAFRPEPSIGTSPCKWARFTDHTNAERLRERLLARYQPIFIQDFDAPNGHFYRVRVGRVPNPDAAQHLAAQLRNATDSKHS